MLENIIDSFGGSIVFNKTTLAQSAATNGNFKTAHALHGTEHNVEYTIDGVYATYTPADNLNFNSGHTTIPAGCQCVFGVWVDAGGNTGTNQGKIVSATEVAQGKTVVPMPNIVKKAALLGLIEVKTAGAAQFVPNTTNLNATNVTATFFSTSCLPSNPLQT